MFLALFQKAEDKSFEVFSILLTDFYNELKAAASSFVEVLIKPVELSIRLVQSS